VEATTQGTGGNEKTVTSAAPGTAVGPKAQLVVEESRKKRGRKAKTKEEQKEARRLKQMNYRRRVYGVGELAD